MPLQSSASSSNPLCLSESECKELVKYAFSLNEITNFHLRILENQKLNDELIEYSRN
jgi:hypothetical protein